eukprot:scaffold207620_cov36-Prasinocladus_malaysianus.AAC.1
MERLIKVADPDGWFRPKSKAAAEAKAKAVNELMLAKQKKAAAEAAKLAAAQKEADAEPFVPEEEDDNDEESIDTKVAQSNTVKASPPTDPLASSSIDFSGTTPSMATKDDNKGNPDVNAKAKKVYTVTPGPPPTQPSTASHHQAKSSKKAAGSGKKSIGGLGGLLSREDIARQMTTGVDRPPPKDLHSRAAATVADTLAI